jgi:hypothetical protein
MDIRERLEQIERLERQNAPVAVLLQEVRELLAEAEAWVRSEARGNERAEAAVQVLREALERRDETVPAAERTLVA